MTTRRSPSASLAALIAAAAVLTPVAAAVADDDDVANEHRVSYRYTNYDEDPLDAAPVEGDARRYRVDAHQFQVDTGLGDSHALKVSATQEIMSGSSPWFMIPGDDGRPLQVMSGATIKDDRREIGAVLTRHPDTQTPTSLSLSYSHEDDYRATAIGVEHSLPLGSAVTLGFGASASHDIIDPTDPELHNRIDHATKNTQSAFVSFAFVLDRASVLQTGVQVNRHDGYLSDPYKRFYNGGRIVRDSRPELRWQGAWLLRYRHAFAEQDAALHADYRYATDSWGLRSHTFDVAWYQSLGAGWRLVPNVRYYSQHGARFYAPFFEEQTAVPFYSSDYRLSDYGAVSGGLNARKRFGAWELSVGVDRYRSTGGLAIGGDDTDTPSLVDFTRVFAGFDYLFE